MDVFKFCLYSACNRVRLNSIRDNELEEEVGERERERKRVREGKEGKDDDDIVNSASPQNRH